MLATNFVFLFFENFSNTFTATTAANVDAIVATNVGPIISAGFLEPAAYLYATTLDATNVTDEVFIAKNIHIAFDAVSFSSFNS